MLCTLLMAGGSGLRLWPLSRPERTKPLLVRPGAARSLLAETAARVAFVPPSRRFVNVTRGLQGLVHDVLPDLPEDHVIVAPEDRDTLPTLVFATARIARLVPDATLVLLASDNAVGDEDAFRTAIERAVTAAEAGPHLVSLGIEPTEASTRFGYMALGDAYPGLDETWFGTAYVEKPKQEIADALFAGKRHDWNAGIFAWTIATFRRALEAYAPSEAAIFERLCTASTDAERAALFRELRPIAVDHGLLEHVPPSGGAVRHVFVRGRFPWDDLGTFEALTKELPIDADGNAMSEGVVARGCRGSLLVTEGPFTLEAHDLVDTCVVVSDVGDTLVADRRALGEIRAMLEQRIELPAIGAPLVRALGAEGSSVEATIPAITGLLRVQNAHVSLAPGRVIVRTGTVATASEPGPRIFVATDDAEFARIGADLVIDALRVSLARAGDREVLVTLSAGKTPVDLYRVLASRHRSSIAWDRVRLVQMDEWVGIGPEDPRSFACELARALVEPLGMRATFIDGRAGEAPVIETERYVLDRGGLALALLGIGTNGHFGFNEPPSDAASEARRVTLAPSTRAASATTFDGDAPTEGVTLGLRSLVHADKTIVIARGAHKSRAIEAMFAAPTRDWPASAIARTDRVDVLLDRAALADAWAKR